MEQLSHLKVTANRLRWNANGIMEIEPERRSSRGAFRKHGCEPIGDDLHPLRILRLPAVPVNSGHHAYLIRRRRRRRTITTLLVGAKRQGAIAQMSCAHLEPHGQVIRMANHPSPRERDRLELRKLGRHAREHGPDEGSMNGISGFG